MRAGGRGEKKGQITREKNRPGESAKEKKGEKSRRWVSERGRERESGSRSATLHSGVFHFNGPPGDWLTRAPSLLLSALSLAPFSVFGIMDRAHYLFAGRTVSPRARDRESLAVIIQARAPCAPGDETGLCPLFIPPLSLPPLRPPSPLLIFAFARFLPLSGRINYSRRAFQFCPHETRASATCPDMDFKIYWPR